MAVPAIPAEGYFLAELVRPGRLAILRVNVKMQHLVSRCNVELASWPANVEILEMVAVMRYFVHAAMGRLVTLQTNVWQAKPAVRMELRRLAPDILEIVLQEPRLV